MFDRLFRKAEPEAQPEPQAPAAPAAAAPSRAYEVGWLFHTDKSSVIWGTPQPIRTDAHSQAAKSVGVCPAVIEFERRHFVIPCPVDIHMRLQIAANGTLNITNVLGEKSPLRQGQLNQMLIVMPQNEWRHPGRPVIQIATPYLFVSDDPVYVNQFPPYLHYGPAPRPGVQLCGRFPIDVWPRHIMWAFEWHDLTKDLILKRGEPWFYVRFEGGDPAAQVRLFEAEKTNELMAYVDSLTDVTNYVNQTFSLMKTAKERRPEKLVYPKKR